MIQLSPARISRMLRFPLAFMLAAFFLTALTATALAQPRLILAQSRGANRQARQAAIADLGGWDISSFNTDVTINKDSSIDVTETITADFSREEHHGIVRIMPIRYRDDFGNKLSLQFNLISVTDGSGKPWMNDVSYEGDNVDIQIGDPDVTYNEPETYVIKYSIVRAVNFFKDHDELYWNATGTDWGVPILKAGATVTLPAGVNDKDIQVKCYTGYYGSAESNCTARASGGKAAFEVTAPSADQPALDSNQGLTVVVGWPKGIVNQPSWFQYVLWFLRDNWGFALPLLTFGLLYYLWYTRGRDPKISRTAIMPVYDPPDKLTPTEVGTIIDESADMRDITSAIIDMAVRGYIKITETKSKKFLFESTDYEFKKLKDFAGDPKLKDHEKKIMDAVFGQLDTKMLSDLQNKFYSNIPGIKTQIYNQLIKDGYFPTNPEKIRNIYYTIGGVVLSVMVFFAGIWFSIFSLSVPLGLILSAIIILIFVRYMPARTKKGVETFYQIKGLELFIGTAEKDRLKWEEKENIFEKLLPYAITLGLADKWSSAFAGIYKTPPNWYGSSDPNFANQFSTFYLLNSLNRLNNSMQTTFVSAPRSSGGSAWGGGSGFSGGFSGGGFGGGGGHAW